ncbi:MAG: EpsG family protein [Porphyromonadaceae bacterium]|nr:EpsG family protein [Porphyromonadaceae bacterium]
MLIYLSVILFCLILAFFKLPKFVENGALILIAVFLCFGYMTGTDWYNYEIYYNNIDIAEKILKNRESGYLIVQSFFSRIGVDFWVFHIAVKLLVFIALIYFLKIFDVNIFFFLVFFIPFAGFYLFIDCPFRNLIAFGFSLIAFRKLFENKHISFFVFTFLALLFHISALFLIFTYVIYKRDFKVLFIIITTVIIYSLAFNAKFIINKIYLPLIEISPVINARLGGYVVDSRYITDSINLGSFLRLFIILIMVIFKNIIVGESKFRLYIFNLGILYLILYPLGISMKVIQRIIIYISPFFVLGILFLLKSFKIKSNRYLMGLFFVLFTFWQTYSLVTVDYRYVPYSNYLYHWVKKDFPSIEYRRDYNKKKSPYKKKK